MQILRADTAVNVKIGPFVDVADGFTPQTDIGLAGDEAELLKHGTTNTADISGNAWGAITGARGWYWLTLSASDTDTEGPLVVVVQDDSDCLPVFTQFMVVNANVYDSLYGTAAADYLTVDMLQIGGVAQSATDLKDFADTGYNPATHKVAGVVLTDTTTTNTDMRGTDNVVLAGATKAEMDTAHALLATPAQVNTEVVDALGTDTIAELAQGVPTATPTIKTAIMLLYMAMRNKLNVDTNKEITNDAGTVIAKKALTDDGTTYSEAEMISGA